MTGAPKWITWVLGALISLGTIASSTYLFVDGMITEAVADEAKTREQRDYETQLELINLELKQLNAKTAPTSDDTSRINYLRERRKVIMDHLEELR